MIKVQILDGEKLIEDACALLYQTHIQQAQWQFLPDNPSRVSIVIRHGEKILFDRFTYNAIWFGAFDNKKLVGCTRLTFADKNNKLEVEGYHSSSAITEFLPDDKSKCVESTRTAVAASYTGQGIVRKLLLAAFKYCQDNHYSISACVSNAYLKSLLKNIGYPLKLEHAFKYESQDPVPVNFYFADYNKSEVQNMVIALETYKNITQNNYAKKLFESLDFVAPILPNPVYWHNTEGVVLGLNSHCLNGMGAPSIDAIIGKTPYDFYPKEIADYIWKHSKQVIKTGETLSQDETIRDISTEEAKVFRNIKAPLYDDEGNIVGVIGTAIDVTAEKEAEQLRAEKYKNNLFRSFTEQMTGLINRFQVLNDRGESELHLTNTNIKLTKRETEVLYFLSRGQKPKSIAIKLGISSKTVQSIVDGKLFPKFGLYNITDLIEQAQMLNLIPLTIEL